MMYHNSIDNAGDSWTEDIISVYIQVRFLFQQQTGHLPLLVHGSEASTETMGEPTFCKTATETRASSNTTWLERNSRSFITCVQEPYSLISIELRLRDLSKVACPTRSFFTTSVQHLTPDYYFTYQNLLSSLSELEALHPKAHEV